MTKTVNILFSIVFFVIFAVVLFTITTSRFALYGMHSYIVQTGSMEPQIHVGSVVFTRPNTYNIGDIITFNRGTITVTHRLVGEKNNQYITKGDANKIADPEPVNKNDVIGKDVLIVPYIGRAVEYLKTVPGFLIFVALPILIYVFFEMRNFKKEWEKEVEKKLLKKLDVAKET
jgi:signal peptidase